MPAWSGRNGATFWNQSTSEAMMLVAIGTTKNRATSTVMPPAELRSMVPSAKPIIVTIPRYRVPNHMARWNGSEVKFSGIEYIWASGLHTR